MVGCHASYATVYTFVNETLHYINCLDFPMIHVVHVPHVEEREMKQNITLSLEKDLIKKAKILAAHKETSITGLLKTCLENLVSQQEIYQTAKEKALKQLNKGYVLGGQRITRNSLHER
jgi:hypothetical protein